MINLLPAAARTRARQEYRRRALALWTFLAAAVAVIASVFLLPTDLMLEQQMAAAHSAESQIQTTLQDPALLSSAQEVSASSALLSRISAVAASPRPSAILQLILAARPSGIAVEEISVSTAGAAASVNLGGIAATRDALLGYKTALLAIPGVGSADFPVGDLAASSTIAFTIDVHYTPPPSR